MRSDGGDLLDRIRAEIDERMADLRPQVEEHRRLLAAADSLSAGEDSPTPAGRARPSAPKRAKAGSRETTIGARRAPASGRRAVAGAAPAKPQGRRGATQQAIEAALEHGSHTLAELVQVTAMQAAPIRAQLGRLQGAGVVRRVRRDGKSAYSLPGAVARIPTARRAAGSK